MAVAYLMISLIMGIVCAAVGLIGFGAGLLAVFLWYVAGSWIGFAASLILYLLIGARQPTPSPQWPDGSRA